MDPDHTWKAMIEAIVANDLEAASDLAICLIDWLDKGGFSPRVLPDLGQAANDPHSVAYRLDRMIVSYVCARVRSTN